MLLNYQKLGELKSINSVAPIKGISFRFLMAVLIPLALLIFPAIFGLLTPHCYASNVLVTGERIDAEQSLTEGSSNDAE